MTQADVKIAFDRGAEPHDPDLYRFDAIAHGVDGLDSVGPAEIQQFQQEGWLVINKAWSAQEVQAAKAGLSDLIQEKVAGKYQLMFEAAVSDRLAELTPQQREESIRKVFQFHDVDDRLDALAFDARLLNVVERLGCTSPKLFQTMALLKGPNGREKPWHQDRAYFNYEPDKPIVGVWIALDEATPENGCMVVIPGEHRKPFIHFHRRDWQICDTDIQAVDSRRLAVPMQPGSMLLFDSLLPHGTPRNTTDRRRRALQYHYMPEDLATSSQEERMAIFGAEGKDVEC